MSYQVTLNSRNVLVPLALTGRDGEQLNVPLAKLDTATALMIQVSASGAFTQEFFPLKISQYPTQAYSGAEWELQVQKAGEELYAYYLGIPDQFFSEDGITPSARSLSIQVVGTSPLTGRETFSGGEDIILQKQVVSPLIPGFLNLSELFFPTLLPQNFIATNTLDVFDFQNRRQLVLMSTLQMDSAARIPVSLEKHWEPNNWIQAVVENLAPDRYFLIRGGCFYSRNRKITHWFGGSIGLEEKNFRTAAAKKIHAMGSSENGAWVFWLDPGSAGQSPAGQGPVGQSPGGSNSGVFDVGAFVRSVAEAAQTGSGTPLRLSIRHSILHSLLVHREEFSLPSSEHASLEGLPARQSVAALASMARIVAKHQSDLQHARSEPAHALWSQSASPTAFPLDALGGRSTRDVGSTRTDTLKGLEAEIRELYLSHGEILRSLESLFEKTYGYSSWDAVGEPLRETLKGYLADTNEFHRSLQ